MRLSERMKCKHNELIELTICMVGGTESGARIYNTKIRRNRAAFPDSTKSRKLKGKDDKNLFWCRNIDMPFIDIWWLVGELKKWKPCKDVRLKVDKVILLVE